MTRNLLAKVIIITACVVSTGQTRPANTQSSAADWKAVETAIGKTGSLQPGDVFKIGLPRNDLTVTVRGVSISPDLVSAEIQVGEFAHKLKTFVVR
jgi:hypothetical protein